MAALSAKNNQIISEIRINALGENSRDQYRLSQVKFLKWIIDENHFIPELTTKHRKRRINELSWSSALNLLRQAKKLKKNNKHRL